MGLLAVIALVIVILWYRRRRLYRRNHRVVNLENSKWKLGQTQPLHLPTSQSSLSSTRPILSHSPQKTIHRLSQSSSLNHCDTHSVDIPTTLVTQVPISIPQLPNNEKGRIIIKKPPASTALPNPQDWSKPRQSIQKRIPIIQIVEETSSSSGYIEYREVSLQRGPDVAENHNIMSQSSSNLTPELALDTNPPPYDPRRAVIQRRFSQ